MPKLVFDKKFLEDFHKLEPVVRQKVLELPAKFEQQANASVHLEKLEKQRDARTRTVRVDQFWRGVVVQLGHANYALLRVMPHDDANAWAVNQKFGVNPITGIVELVDVPAVEALADEIAPSTQSVANEGPLANVADKAFRQVGVDEEFIPILRRLGSESELYALANLLPPAQADAVLMLAEGKNPDEVWTELAEEYEVKKEEIDVDDITKALDRPASKAMFVVTTNDNELKELLSGDFEAWRTFLHPNQRKLAERPVFKGPARVTGGAGTGKTVVAMHRARFLVRRLIDSGDTTSSVLIATYTSSLRDNLEQTLRSFCTPAEFKRLTISTVDSLAAKTLSAAKVKMTAATGEWLDKAVADAAAMAGLDEIGLTPHFLHSEWDQVILARRITDLPTYANSPRPGRGRSLNREHRKKVWSAVQFLLKDLDLHKKGTFHQIADTAADLLASRAVPPFAHIVVDEAQDLHPAQWRLLRAAVAPGDNDLFIVGDAHQRIYANKVSLASIGIETRGRSRQLKINYRTSQQILSWTLGILTGEPVDDLDGGADNLTGYRSAFSGPRPRLFGFTTGAEEADFVATQVKEWVDDKVLSGSIGVLGRTGADLKAVRDAFKKLGIKNTGLGGTERREGVLVGTMHSSKGLEFSRLFVVGVNADRVPFPKEITPESEDPEQHRQDIHRERCLLYVACTRARDELIVSYSGQASPLLPPDPGGEH